MREYPTDAGSADYALLVDRRPVGIVEAKKEATLLTPVVDQSGKYAQSKHKWFEKSEPLPFVYESSGAVTHFRDYRDTKPRSRSVFTFHKPETFGEWMKEGSSVRARLLSGTNPNISSARELSVT